MELSKEILLKEFGANLKRLRESQGLTLMDLELKSGINNGDISRIEGGKINFTFTTLVKLARGLEISVSNLTSVQSLLK